MDSACDYPDSCGKVRLSKDGQWLMNVGFHMTDLKDPTKEKKVYRTKRYNGKNICRCDIQKATKVRDKLSTLVEGLTKHITKVSDKMLLSKLILIVRRKIVLKKRIKSINKSIEQ